MTLFVVVEEVVLPSVKSATNTQVDREALVTLELQGDTSECNQVPRLSDITSDTASERSAALIGEGIPVKLAKGVTEFREKYQFQPCAGVSELLQVFTQILSMHPGLLVMQ